MEALLQKKAFEDHGGFDSKILIWIQTTQNMVYRVVAVMSIDKNVLNERQTEAERFREALRLLAFQLHTRDTRSFWFYLDTACTRTSSQPGVHPGDQQGATKTRGLCCSAEPRHRPPDCSTRFPRTENVSTIKKCHPKK